MSNSWTTNDNIRHALSAKSRGFYHEWSKYIITDRDFIMNGRDFHDDRLRFSWRQVEVLFWTVQMLTMMYNCVG